MGNSASIKRPPILSKRGNLLASLGNRDLEVLGRKKEIEIWIFNLMLKRSPSGVNTCRLPQNRGLQGGGNLLILYLNYFLFLTFVFTFRSWWITDMAWTRDSLLVVCITRRGSVCILTKLGEPMEISTEGCSLHTGPAFFLPLHPKITFQWVHRNPF